jgi:hypothetical protein
MPVGLVRTGEAKVYDVLHVDGPREKVVGSGLAKQAACELARAEARRRRIGRMFLAGSETGPVTECMLIVHSSRNGG